MGITQDTAFRRGMMSAFDIFGGMGTMPIPLPRRRRPIHRPASMQDALSADLARIGKDFQAALASHAP